MAAPKEGHLLTENNPQYIHCSTPDPETNDTQQPQNGTNDDTAIELNTRHGMCTSPAKTCSMLFLNGKKHPF